jgi:two-component system, LytTR family, sensor kinase
VEHGITPALRGGCITLSAHLASDRIVIELADTGVGLPAGGVPGVAPDAPSAGKQGGKGGVGLANSRLRLAQAFGDAAQLELLDNPAGQGCLARLSLPAGAAFAVPATPALSTPATAVST